MDLFDFAAPLQRKDFLKPIYSHEVKIEKLDRAPSRCECNSGGRINLHPGDPAVEHLQLLTGMYVADILAPTAGEGVPDVP